MKILLEEFKTFSKNNWWIYIIFLICIYIIWYTNTWNILEVTLIFFAHFLWDLFIMLMASFYSIWEMKKWSLSQMWSYIVFWLLWLYSWLINWKWWYLIPSLSFLFPNLKSYFKDVRNKEIGYLDWKLSFIVWIFVFILYFFFWLIKNIWDIVQVLWFVLFPLSLMLNIWKTRYFLSLIWIFFIAFGSWYQLMLSFIDWRVSWIDISYTLLPLTVFVYFLKSIKKYL